MYPQLQRVITLTNQVVVHLRALSYQHGSELLESTVFALDALDLALLEAESDWHHFFPGLDARLIQVSYHAHQLSISCIHDFLVHLQTIPGALRSPAISACLREFAGNLTESNAILTRRLESLA